MCNDIRTNSIDHVSDVPRSGTNISIKILKLMTPEKITVIILKFEQGGFSIQQCVEKM